MMLAFQLGMAAYLSGLAGFTLAGCYTHYRNGQGLQAATDAGFTLVLAALAALVLARTL
ncbi:hypothetical protein [Bosea minatitlanensis]|uniref:Uncharacterized protein n=1 Tax=Bosea minatitlanensis TaxID=128782 RepID=A0ABW0EZY1_9HYPH|nr:hypothetical protein [Bosea minatitlanensis]MCT4496039.1 hypothetical protein [Bosea minatitlanensis]